MLCFKSKTRVSEWSLLCWRMDSLSVAEAPQSFKSAIAQEREMVRMRGRSTTRTRLKVYFWQIGWAVWRMEDPSVAALLNFPNHSDLPPQERGRWGESVEDEPWWPSCSFCCPGCPEPVLTTCTTCQHQFPLYNICYLAVALNATFCCPLTPYWGHWRLSGVGISEPRDAAS